MRIQWNRSTEWRQQQAMAHGVTMPKRAEQDIPAEWITNLPMQLRRLLVQDGVVVEHSNRLSWRIGDDGPTAERLGWHVSRPVVSAQYECDTDTLTPDTLSTMLEVALADVRREYEKRCLHGREITDAAIVECLSRGTKYYLSKRGDTTVVAMGNAANYQDHPEVADLLARARAEAEARTERQRQQAAEAKAEAERRHERLLSQLGEAIHTLGDQSQRERWDAGVMATADAIAIVRDDALRPLRTAELHVREHDYQIPSSERDSYSHLGTLSAEEWTVARQIRALLPDATIQYAVEYGTTADPDDWDGSCDVVRRRVAYAEVSMVVGAVKVEADVILSDVSTTQTDD